jgi:tetratricopeptide (TPR) repeat protein
MTHLPERDEALLAAAKAAATTHRPTSSQTARRARALEAAIARHAERQRRAVPRRTAAVAALLLASAASATTAFVVGVVDDEDDDIAVDAVAAVAARVPAPLRVRATATARVDELPALATVAASTNTGTAAAIVDELTTTKATTKTTTKTKGPRRSVEGAAPRSFAEVPPGAARFVARDEALATVVGVEDVEDVDGSGGEDDVATADGSRADNGDVDVTEARALRDRCIDGLRSRRDRAALEDCRVFGQRFPAHASARALAFGAGGLAEELGLPREALAAYSRAVLLSPLVGSASDDALLARARVHAGLGEVDEARADLLIYLHRSPQAAGAADVERLRRALRLAD